MSKPAPAAGGATPAAAASAPAAAFKGPSLNKLLKEISPHVAISSQKVTVVGAGQVGMAGAFALLTLGVCTDLAIVDVRQDAAVGEKMDLVHGQAFLGKRCNITADSDYAVSKGSKICVITAGARQKEGETRLDLVQKNVGIFKGIIPPLVKYSPDCILVIVSNPCDVMAWVAWKLSGFPKHRVVSSGTMLDTSRFRYLLGERLGVGAQSCHGYIIGEHGDSSVAVWSSVNIGGTRLKDIAPGAGKPADQDPENWQQLHKDVVGAAYEIIKLKGYTNWGIGIMIAKLCDVILRNQRTVMTVGAMPDGWNGINDEVYISIPCVIGEHGITHVLHQLLAEDEVKKVQESAGAMRKVIEGLKM